MFNCSPKLETITWKKTEGREDQDQHLQFSRTLSFFASNKSIERLRLFQASIMLAAIRIKNYIQMYRQVKFRSRRNSQDKYILWRTRGGRRTKPIPPIYLRQIFAAALALIALHRLHCISLIALSLPSHYMRKPEKPSFPPP